MLLAKNLSSFLAHIKSSMSYFLAEKCHYLLKKMLGAFALQKLLAFFSANNDIFFFAYNVFGNIMSH